MLQTLLDRTQLGVAGQLKMKNLNTQIKTVTETIGWILYSVLFTQYSAFLCFSFVEKG